MVIEERASHPPIVVPAMRTIIRHTRILFEVFINKPINNLLRTNKKYLNLKREKSERIELRA